jgi:uncharacterized membrane protein
MTDAAITRYLHDFALAARRRRLGEWREIAEDLRSHINEALDHGKPIEDVLAALGAPAALARAYAVELLMQRSLEEPGGALFRALRLVGAIAAGGVVTLIVAGALGVLGLTFLFSGIALFTIGLLAAGGVHLPNVRLGGLSPWLYVAAAPIVLGLGWAACWALWRYARAVARALTRTLPSKQEE